MSLNLSPWFVCPAFLKLRRWVAVVLRATARHKLVPRRLVVDAARRAAGKAG